MPSRGAETCLVVEQLFSLNIIHEIQGDAFFAERAETIAYNALPAVGTKDLWSRVYLQQANEVFAGTSRPHVWATDGDDALDYSLSQNYECCTANVVQGWPRMIQHMIHSTPDGGLAVSILGPVSAVLKDGVRVNVTGDYPFEDDITVTLSGLPEGAVAYPLYIRIPSWATNATLSVNDAAPSDVGSSNGTMLRVMWPGGVTGPSASVRLSTNPAVRTAPAYNGALAVSRGALLYSLRLDETFEVVRRAPLEPRAADYVVSQPGCDLRPGVTNCTAPWNVAVIVADAAHPEAGFTFTKTGDVPPIPFAGGLWGSSNLELTASVSQVAGWGMALNAAGAPPSSPVDCSASGACSAPYLATWVPYGSTHLRMGELPWALPTSCTKHIGFSGSSVVELSAGAASDFTLDGFASIEPNGDADNIRSGDPGDVSDVAWSVSAQDASHSIVGVEFAYQYVAGYGGNGAPGGAVMELIAVTPGACGIGPGELPVVSTLYTSPPLVNYSYDVCNTCYSPPVSVVRSSLNLNATQGLLFALRFTDNQRNVQLKLPMNLTVTWG
jgi:hypothetical protein